MTKLTDSAPNNIAADLLAQDTICLDPGIDLGSLDWMQSGAGTSINWSNLTIAPLLTTTQINTLSPSYQFSTTVSPKLSLQGDDADIEINGQSLMKMLQSLQHRLGWLQPNAQLEAEWDELRALGERYRELEKICEEKSKAWQCLKNLPPPVIP